MQGSFTIELQLFQIEVYTYFLATTNSTCVKGWNLGDKMCFDEFN